MVCHLPCSPVGSEDNDPFSWNDMAAWWKLLLWKLYPVTKLGRHSWDPSISGLPAMVELLLSEWVLGVRSGPQAS